MEIKEILEEIRGGLASQKEEYTKLSGTILQLNERLTVVETGIKSRTVSLPGVNEGKDKGKFSFARAIYAIATGDWDSSPFERDVFNQTRKRALSEGVDSKGGYIVPVQYVAELIELFRAETVAIELGATMMGGLTGSPVEIPKQTGGATGFWVAESSAITDSDQAFGQVLLTPKQASGMTKLSNRLLKISNPGIEAIVRDDLAKTLARLIDLAVLRGTGGANQPLGIANTPGINEVEIGVNGGEITYDFLVSMIEALDTDNALRGKLGWGFHPKIKSKIAKLKDADDRPLFTWDPSGIQPSTTLLGYPWKTTSQIPINLTKGAGIDLSEIYFGNWAEVLIGQWGGLSIDVSTQAGDAFEKNQSWVRIIQEVDVALRHPESMCLINDVETV